MEERQKKKNEERKKKNTYQITKILYYHLLTKYT